MRLSNEILYVSQFKSVTLFGAFYVDSKPGTSFLKEIG